MGGKNRENRDFCITLHFLREGFFAIFFKNAKKSKIFSLCEKRGFQKPPKKVKGNAKISFFAIFTGEIEHVRARFPELFGVKSPQKSEG